VTPGGLAVLEYDVESCMGDTDHWLHVHRNQDGAKGARLLGLSDPHRHAIAFSDDGLKLFQQRSGGVRPRYDVYSLETGERLKGHPPPVQGEALVSLLEWQEQSQVELIRPRDEARFEPMDPVMARVQALSPAERLDQVRRLAGGAPGATAWQMLLEVLGAWQGEGLDRGLDLAGELLEAWPDGLRAAADLTCGQAHPGWRLVRSPAARPLRFKEAALAGCPPGVLLEQLRWEAPPRLSVHGWPHGDETLAALLRAPALREISELWLEDCPVGPAARDALAGSPQLASVRTMALRRCRVDDAAVAALARSRILRRLKVLLMVENQVGDAGVEALARGELLGRLTTLDLDDNAIGPRGVAALAAAPDLVRLGDLRLRGASMDEAAMAALARALYHLRVLGIDVLAPWTRRVATSFDLTRQWTELHRAAQEQRCLEARQTAPEQLKLRVLAHSDNHLDDTGNFNRVALTCEVLEARRSATGLEPGRVVEVAAARHPGTNLPDIPANNQRSEAWLAWAECPAEDWRCHAGRLAHLRQRKQPCYVDSPRPDTQGFYIFAAGELSFEPGGFGPV